MRVLVACEFSGVVREAFRARGHDVMSCDLLPAEDGSLWHFQFDVLKLWTGNLAQSFRLENALPHYDLMIAFPPCTHLAVSGARWFKHKQESQGLALKFVLSLMNAPYERIAIENPVSIISSKIRKPDQTFQPHQFGHPEFKRTCLWLKNLPPLQPTNELVVPERNSDEWKRWNRVHREPPGSERWKARSRTYQGVADAMAQQWGQL